MYVIHLVSDALIYVFPKGHITIAIEWVVNTIFIKTHDMQQQRKRASGPFFLFDLQMVWIFRQFFIVDMGI